MSDQSRRNLIRLSERGESSRARILEAGLEIFSEYTLREASTRQITELAGVNLASINYHFRGKEGLYHAVIEQIMEEAKTKMLPMVSEIQTILQRPKLKRVECIEMLKKIFHAFTEIMIGNPKAEKWAKIIVREQMNPSTGLDIIYEGMIKHVHTTVCRLIAHLEKKPEHDPEIIMKGHSLIGQVLVFRYAHEIIKRRLGIERFEPSHIDQIHQLVEQHINKLYATPTQKTSKSKS